MFIVVVAVGALVWSGVRFVLDALHRRRSRPGSDERPATAAYQPPSLAEEAHEWLSRQ